MPPVTICVGGGAVMFSGGPYTSVRRVCAEHDISQTAWEFHQAYNFDALADEDWLIRFRG